MPRNIIYLSYEYRRRYMTLAPNSYNANMVKKLFSISAFFPTSSLETDEPLVSVVTTSYKSSFRIYRAYESMLRQTYDNWEWIIYDDTADLDDGENWNRLKQIAATDYRIRLLRGFENDGIIGSVKHIVSMTSRGALIAELDHDDRLDKDCLKWVVQAALDNPNSPFIFTQGCEVNEHNDSNHTYAPVYAYGYGSYGNVIVNDNSRAHSHFGVTTPKTVRSLTGMPNHLRVWNAKFYRKCEGNSPRFGVSDDYELLLKTYLKAEFVRIPLCAYIQYRNAHGNNFTFLRNAFIQYLVGIAYAHYYPDLKRTFIKRDIPDLPLASRIVSTKPERICHEKIYPVWLPNYEETIDIVIAFDSNFVFTYKQLMTYLDSVLIHPYVRVIIVSFYNYWTYCHCSMLPIEYARRVIWFNYTRLEETPDNDHKEINDLVRPLNKKMFMRNYALLNLVFAPRVIFPSSKFRLLPKNFITECISSPEKVFVKDNCLYFFNDNRKYLFWKCDDTKKTMCEKLQ